MMKFQGWPAQKIIVDNKTIISKYKSYLAQKMRMIQNLHDRKNIAVEKKIKYQLETSHKHSDGFI